ncbi:hypothetical protein NHX12_016897 [Muraenolepis orangiensis]|uniref:Ionotropic glutamate receptor C-terminal domain-containing protein n=1 Tax=Muraenolepis orangiensis TaxID=630683 RepID=A0A9Q0D7T4_9TELE|nr:hypothetical protein NHX12_016897 [Muraenolepis orangiensis]
MIGTSGEPVCDAATEPPGAGGQPALRGLLDMLKELAHILQFKYRIRLVADGRYGVPGANGTWTGMPPHTLWWREDASVLLVPSLVLSLSPYEWFNPHRLKGRCNLLINQYSLGNSFWFPVGGFMQQGSTIGPRALSTRCLRGVCWAVTLIIILSYTANLAAFLTVQRMEAPVESVDDPADRTAIEYGGMHGGST